MKINQLKRVRMVSALDRLQKELKKGQSQESINRGVSEETWRKTKQREINTLEQKLGA